MGQHDDHGHHGHGHHGHGHHHHGHHHHGPGAHVHLPTRGDPRRALALALALNGGFLVVELAIGLWTDSLALLSDAAHMASDVAALVMALGAAQLARRPPSATQTFGLLRSETLGAFVNGLSLLVAAGFIVGEAAERLAEGHPHIDGVPVLVVALVGFLINLGSAVALWRSDRENLNVRGALAHMLADAAGSVGAAVAALLLLAGFGWADAVVSLVLALLVAWGAWVVLRESGRVLLQLPPPGFDVAHLVADLRTLDHVLAVRDVHVWTLDGRMPIVTGHLVVRPEADALAVVASAGRLVREGHGVSHATFQVEAPGEHLPDDPHACEAGSPPVG